MGKQNESEVSYDYVIGTDGGIITQRVKYLEIKRKAAKKAAYLRRRRKMPKTLSLEQVSQLNNFEYDSEAKTITEQLCGGCLCEGTEEAKNTVEKFGGFICPRCSDPHPASSKIGDLCGECAVAVRQQKKSDSIAKYDAGLVESETQEPGVRKLNMEK